MMSVFKPASPAASANPKYAGRLLIVGIDDGHGLAPKPTAGKRTPPLPSDIDVNKDGVPERKKGERIYENEENRGVAKYAIAGLLRCGLGVVEAAPGDEDPSLPDRQKTIRAAKAVCSVSIHKNGAGSGSQWLNASGISAFNHADAGCYTADGLKLGQLVLDECAKSTGKAKRGNGKVSRKALSMVNEKYIGCPAALVELGFQDNIKDAPEMLDPVFWDKAADGIVRAVCTFLSVPYIPKDGTPVVQPPAEACPYTRPQHLPKYGDDDDKTHRQDVRWLQWQLTDHGYGLPKYGIDGQFGKETKAAMDAYAGVHKVSGDDIIRSLAGELSNVIRYIVKAGDTPWNIAKDHDLPGSDWVRITREDRKALDPKDLSVGDVLLIPRK
jgi:N-acetylmuramoyl-L-alanine amidase